MREYNRGRVTTKRQGDYRRLLCRLVGGLRDPLMGGPPTVNGLSTTSNATGSIGTEVGDKLCYLFGLQQTADGPFHDHNLFYYLGFGNAMYTRLIGYLLLDKWRAHIRWADGVTGHAMFCAFKGCHSR